MRRIDGTARSVLLSVLGDVVRPDGGATWLGALSAAAETLGIAPATTRQALRRLVAQDFVVREQHGRLARYRVTPAAAERLEEAATRIYAADPPSWDGRWRLLTYTFAEERRSARDALRRELGWLGYGPLSTSTFVCPWDRGGRLAAVLDKHEVADDVDTFTATHDGDDRELAARAYDLSALRALHERFLDDVAGWEPAALSQLPPAEAFRRRIELVHSWRRTLFLDPGLPDPLTPPRWRGAAARARFSACYDALSPAAERFWRDLVEAATPNDVQG